jgi:hypothetical protein
VSRRRKHLRHFDKPFNSWSTFATAAGDQRGTRKSFARLLEQRGFTPHRLHGGVRAWRGIQLRPRESGDTW